MAILGIDLFFPVHVPCVIDAVKPKRIIRRMSKRLKQDKLTGPNGETVKVNWMPDGRIRLDFMDCGTCAVTKIFPDPKGQTHIEINYGK